jgi:uncharacterized protein with HEPN domain
MQQASDLLTAFTGYMQVDNRLVWDIVQTRLSTLRREITALLEE